jgi:hypothetical protein
MPLIGNKDFDKSVEDFEDKFIEYNGLPTKKWWTWVFKEWDHIPSFIHNNKY